MSGGDIILFGRTQSAAQTPFDNSMNGFAATDVQAAIEEAKTGHFSYTLVDVGEVVVVPSGQEMLHVLDLVVLGDLIVLGDTMQLNEDEDDEGFGWTTIPVDKDVTVPVDRVLFYFSPFVVLGNLIVNGFLKEVA